MVQSHDKVVDRPYAEPIMMTSLNTDHNDSPQSSSQALGIDSLKTNEALIFIHLMKTGGTTLFQLIQRHYPEEKTFHYVPLKDGQKLQDLEQMERSQKDQLKFIHGHAKFGFHEHLKQPARYITMLREPVSRVISLYYFTHQNPKRDMPADKWCPTLSSYLDTQLKGFNNTQTRAIAGPLAAQVPFGKETPEMLEMAKQNLDKFLMVGVTERFDESVIVLKHALDLKHILYSRVNENSQKPKIDSIDVADIERIKEYNSLDQQLYAYANQQLDQKIKQIGDAFQDEYETFRQKKKQLNTMFPSNSNDEESKPNFVGRVRQKLKKLWIKIN